MKFLIAALFLSGTLLAAPISQTSEESVVYSPAAISLEGMGQGLFYSLNGSLRVTEQLAINGGIGYIGVNHGGSVLTLPLSASLLLGGKGGHHFELLGGGTFAAATANTSSAGFAKDLKDQDFIFCMGAGYRYWPNDGGFHFRATLYGVALGGFFPYPGFSVGYSF